MTQEASSNEHEEARFQFVSKDLQLEFAGSSEFVNSQIEMFRPALRRALGYEEPSGSENERSGDGGASQGSGRSDLEEFLRGVRTRVGRGALQERILLFIYFLTTVKDRAEVGTEDINFCFDLLGLERPRSLANTLGIMKRNQGLLEAGSRRGTYLCTEKGRNQVGALLVS